MKGVISSPGGKADSRRRIRIIIPAFPAFNIYSQIARITTALGPVSVAAAVNEVEGWDVEVIDENNYRRSGPKDSSGMPDHAALQELRPAQVVGFYGGLTSTIPRLYEVARFYRERGILTIGWWRWYRTWANNVTRFEGWLLMRRWFAEFKKDNFSGKLAEAKKILRQPLPVSEKTWFTKSSRNSI